MTKNNTTPKNGDTHTEGEIAALAASIGTSGLLDAARNVVARWEHGDLAEAVRELAAAVAKAEGGAS